MYIYIYIYMYIYNMHIYIYIHGQTCGRADMQRRRGALQCTCCLGIVYVVIVLIIVSTIMITLPMRISLSMQTVESRAKQLATSGCPSSWAAREVPRRRAQVPQGRPRPHRDAWSRCFETYQTHECVPSANEPSNAHTAPFRTTTP